MSKEVKAVATGDKVTFEKDGVQTQGFVTAIQIVGDTEKKVFTINEENGKVTQYVPEDKVLAEGEKAPVEEVKEVKKAKSAKKAKKEEVEETPVVEESAPVVPEEPVAPEEPAVPPTPEV